MYSKCKTHFTHQKVVFSKKGNFLYSFIGRAPNEPIYKISVQYYTVPKNIFF